MKINKITNDSFETKELGKKIAKKLLEDKKDRERAQILALKGELGSGKTTFLQGFAKGLGIEEKVLSPTFVIFKKFKIKDPDFYLFYHIDCYRIKNSKELLSLGFEDFVKNPKNIIAIEWAEKVKDILPENKITIDFKIKEISKRKIIIRK